jgi:hypothetical protein
MKNIIPIPIGTSKSILLKLYDKDVEVVEIPPGTWYLYLVDRNLKSHWNQQINWSTRNEAGYVAINLSTIETTRLRGKYLHFEAKLISSSGQVVMSKIVDPIDTELYFVEHQIT